MSGVSRLAMPWVLDLKPYEPGKPIEELERELGIEGSVKLASNENPLGPSARAVEAARSALAEVHRYPDGHVFALRRKLAESLGVEGEALLFGNGSDEILELLGKAFLGPGVRAVFGWPAFAMYPIVVRGMGAEPVSVPLTDRFTHDLDAIAAAIDGDTRVVFVCNPNNPTGTSVGREAFDRFAAGLPDSVVLVIDEAYVEYVRRPDFPDGLAWVRRRPGTIVLRTFSKIYGLAGLRVGYGVGDAELVGLLERVRHPFNVNAIGQAAAIAALDDHDHVERSRAVNARGAEYLETELGALGIEVVPTDTNFLIARAGAQAYEQLLHEGVIVRPMAGYGMPEYVRISIGRPEENERAVKTLRRLREEGR